jgi:uncharacterized membrane protein
MVLASAVVVTGLGAAQKAPCADGVWDDLRQYRQLCYTDVVPLLGTEQLQDGRLPFLDPCVPVEGQECDEYPVLTMYFMRVADWVAGDRYGSWFWVNAAFLAVCAIVTVVATYLVAGRRAMYVAVAPSLLIYGTMNWDLLAVALAAAAVAAFAARRDGLAGALLGLGAASKLYPLLLAVPLAAERVRQRLPDRAVSLVWWTAGAWAAVNVPFIVAAPGGWFEFFRFNANRCPEFDSLWTIGFRAAGSDSCAHVGLVGTLSAAAFVGSATFLWGAKHRAQPGFPRWAFGFPLLVAFLLTSKVYSPQYGLWLLPWFALALPDLRAFVAFQVTDVVVFFTRFRWFLELQDPSGGLPRWLFEAAVVARATILIWCLVLWVRRQHEPIESIAIRERGAAELTPA